MREIFPKLYKIVNFQSECTFGEVYLKPADQYSGGRACTCAVWTEWSGDCECDATGEVCNSRTCTDASEAFVALDGTDKNTCLSHTESGPCNLCK